jgi:ABC-type nickel/cobalt efflux system permease component RcnA
MLLALSIEKVCAGLFAVAGFSIGLAVTLVGIGLVVVVSLNKIQGPGRFQWVSSKAPIISAAIVMLSGVAALVFTH